MNEQENIGDLNQGLRHPLFHINTRKKGILNDIGQ